MPHQREPFSFIQLRKPFVLWPIIAAGFILSLLHVMMPTVITENVMGGIWLPIVVFTTMAIVEDFHVGHSVIIFLIVALLVAVLTIVGMSFNIPMLTWLLNFIRVVQFSVRAEIIFTFSSVFTAILVCYGIDIWIRRRWVVSQGALFRRVLGHRSDEQIISPPYAVTYEIPDIMDGVIMWFLGFKGLAGDLIITRDNVEVRRIHMVLGAKELAQRIQPFQAVPTEEQDRSTASQPGQTVPHPLSNN